MLLNRSEGRRRRRSDAICFYGFLRYILSLNLPKLGWRYFSSDALSYTGVAILVNRDTSFDAMYRVEYFAQASTIIGNVFGVGWYVNSSEATVSMFPSVVPKDFFTSHVFNEWVKNGVIVSTSPHILFQGD